MAKYKFGDNTASVENAAGVSGILIRSGDGFLFRVYDQTDGSKFVDYKIRHDDLAVTISTDEMAAFYTTENHEILDHSPDVLGCESIK